MHPKTQNASQNHINVIVLHLHCFISTSPTQFAFVISLLVKTKTEGFENDKRNKVVYPIETSTYCRTLVAFAQITLFVKMSGLDGPDILFLSS